MSAAQTFAEAQALHAEFVAQLEAVRAAHNDVIARLADGPAAPAPMSNSDVAHALLKGDLPPAWGVQFETLQGDELNMRRRLALMTPHAQRLADDVEVQRERARRDAVAAHPKTAKIAAGWAGVERGLRDVLELEATVQRELWGAGLGTEEWPHPKWAQLGLL